MRIGGVTMPSNVNPEYWTRLFKFVNKNSQIPDSARVPMSSWGFPQRENPGNRGYGKTLPRRMRRVQNPDKA